MWNTSKQNEQKQVCAYEGISSFFDKTVSMIKGCRMGRSDKVSLWYVALLINTRFRFFILE